LTLSNTLAAIKTIGGQGATAVISRVVFTNTDTATRTIRVEVVRSGGSAGTGQILIMDQPVGPSQTYVSPEMAGLVLASGDAIWASASTAAVVNCLASGYTQ